MADNASKNSSLNGEVEDNKPSGRMDVHGLTHVGKRRSSNEDQFLIADLKKSLRIYQTSLGLDHQTRLFGGSQGKLLLVADGMGGHKAGDRASTIAVDSITTYALNTMRWLFRLEGESDEVFEQELKSALEHCQAMIGAESEAIPQRRGMGTTLTMAYVIWPRAFVVHVGDSRCYLYREPDLKQITRDHTMSQLFRDQTDRPVQGGRSDEPEASAWNNALWNVLGGDTDDLTPDVYRLDLQFGDALLLCTDGLTKDVAEDQIKRRLAKDEPAEATCQWLVDEANAAGGRDNITVVVARYFRHSDDVFMDEAEADAEAETAEFPTGAPNPQLAKSGSPG